MQLVFGNMCQLIWPRRVDCVQPTHVIWLHPVSSSMRCLQWGQCFQPCFAASSKTGLGFCLQGPWWNCSVQSRHVSWLHSWHVPQLSFLWFGKMYAEQVGFEQYFLAWSLNSIVRWVTLREVNGPRSVWTSLRGMTFLQQRAGKRDSSLTEARKSLVKQRWQ